MGILGSTSKSKSKQIKKTTTIGLDQISAAEGSDTFTLQGVNVKEQGNLAFISTPDVALDASTRALENAAELIEDTGELLSAGFNNALEFAAGSRTQSNQLAATLARGPDSAGVLSESPSRGQGLNVAGTPALLLAAVAVAFLWMKR